ncbi:uncharacterized protein LOC135496971 [Lineus longissimus]|uniref:uncharacterized protein LOC135496971 n=1 Tax=Lineus longissimus TaxID=88925 RepID=UPI00315D34AE
MLLKRCCTCSDPIETCRQCRPPIDGVDEACLQHDYCLACGKRHGYDTQACDCQKAITSQAYKADCKKSPDEKSCCAYRLAVLGVFENFPCVCTNMNTCQWTFQLMGPGKCLVANHNWC